MSPQDDQGVDMRGGSPPDRSRLQRMAALARANDRRYRRADLKRLVAARRVSLSDYVAEPPEWLLGAKVYELLLHVPTVGRVKASTQLNRLRISHSKTFGGLSDRQRRELAAALERFAPAYPLSPASGTTSTGDTNHG